VGPGRAHHSGAGSRPISFAGKPGARQGAPDDPQHADCRLCRAARRRCRTMICVPGSAGIEPTARSLHRRHQGCDARRYSAQDQGAVRGATPGWSSRPPATFPMCGGSPRPSARHPVISCPGLDPGQVGLRPPPGARVPCPRRHCKASGRDIPHRQGRIADFHQKPAFTAARATALSTGGHHVGCDRKP